MQQISLDEAESSWGLQFRASLDALGLQASQCSLTKLVGEASSRVYYRLEVSGKSSFERGVVMQLPEDMLKSDESGNVVSGKATKSGLGELPFLNVRRFLEARGVAVPELIHQDLSSRVLLLEDLGDNTFEKVLQSNSEDAWFELYCEGVDLLIAMQRATRQPSSDCVAYARSFTPELLGWELDHFVEWGIEAVHGPLSNQSKARFKEAFDRLVGEISLGDQVFVHRDFQSRNLMRRERGGWVLIDFQDALLGPEPYDLVALLCDSYVKLGIELQARLLHYYLEKSGRVGTESRGFEKAFWQVALQRKLKDAGRFIYIDRIRGNSDFLPWFEPTFVYLRRALTNLGAEWADLHRLLTEFSPEYSLAVAG